MESAAALLARAGIFVWPWLFALGACTGSFLNVVVYRLPRGLNLAYPGSQCPACGHAIRWYHNLPIVSWFWLRGKCHDCRAPFSIRYAMVELFNALLFVAVAALELRFAAPGQIVLEATLAPGQLLARYLYHLWLLDTLLCAALIQRDGLRVPRRLIWAALAIAVGVAALSPTVQPRFARVMPLDWPTNPRLDATAEAIAGAVIGLLCGWVFAVAGCERQTALAKQTSATAKIVQSGAQDGVTAGPNLWTASCLGAFLGWQAPVLGGLLATIAWLAPGYVRKPRENETAAKNTLQPVWGWDAALFVAAVGWLIVSRLSLDHLPVWLP